MKLRRSAADGGDQGVRLREGRVLELQAVHRDAVQRGVVQHHHGVRVERQALQGQHRVVPARAQPLESSETAKKTKSPHTLQETNYSTADLKTEINTKHSILDTRKSQILRMKIL